MAKLIGIDYGLRRIGVAASDETKMLASPFKVVITGRTLEDTIQNLLDALKEIPYEGFVVGLPLHLSGKDSEMTQKAREFARKLEEVTKLPVKLWDERLTTAEVERVLKSGGVKRKKRTEHKDILSATLILQNYLDAH